MMSAYLERRHPHAGRSYPFSTGDGHDRPGTGDQLWLNGIVLCPQYRLCHQTFQLCLWIARLGGVRKAYRGLQTLSRLRDAK